MALKRIPQTERLLSGQLQAYLDASATQMTTSNPPTKFPTYLELDPAADTVETVRAVGATGNIVDIERGVFSGGVGVPHANSSTWKQLWTTKIPEAVSDALENGYLMEDPSYAFAKSDATTFTVTGADVSDAYVEGRIVRFNGSNSYLGRVESSSYLSSVTTVVIESTGAIPTTITSIELEIGPEGAFSYFLPTPTFFFWNAVPGTPTRVSDTQFTITDTANADHLDLIFKKGVVLKWLESTTINMAMIISSSYGANAVTINVVGDSLTAGFTSMKYFIEKAKIETFIIPGTIVAGTDVSKTWYTPEPVYIFSADAYVKTAGVTNSTVFDINVEGTTKFTTKPTITTGTLSDIDNVADNVSTVVAAASKVTVDTDSVSTTAPVEAYIPLFYMPQSWLYRS